MATLPEEAPRGQAPRTALSLISAMEAFARMRSKVSGRWVRNRCEELRALIPDAWDDPEDWASLWDMSNCPACGHRITDFDPGGCEIDRGQRWCLWHVPPALWGHEFPGASQPAEPPPGAPR
jgi:hypothetical protein